ncbi:peptidoglycan editing factor PgeF [Clostridiaceae bacterium]|nr:peptidoglycan editing factor PgeF [Clostridiaceae bacterium]RKI08987.1 peptidoglycan editing factor PgeF [bacterium 1XD21-70]
MEWIRKTGREKLESKEKNGVVWLEFPALSGTNMVHHGFSTRLGGVSEGKFASMNFTFTRGDNPGHVMENYRRIADALQVDTSRMVLSWQTHTTNIRAVTEKDAGKGIVRERDYQDIDGLITNVPGITLVTFYADCVPLYLLDPVHNAIGLSHSGWRGTVNRMGEKTLNAMAKEYGTRAGDVIACIGPSICQDCFEVGGEVADAFAEAFGESCQAQLYYRKDNGKYQLDLWRANEMVFEEAGVPAANIHTTDICTHCNPGLLFSHRSAGTERGNLAAFLCLSEEGGAER